MGQTMRLYGHALSRHFFQVHPFHVAIGAYPFDGDKKSRHKPVLFKYRNCHGIVAVIAVIECDRYSAPGPVSSGGRTMQIVYQNALKALLMKMLYLPFELLFCDSVFFLIKFTVKEIVVKEHRYFIEVRHAAYALLHAR